MTPVNPDEIIYQISKKVYEKEISKSEGVNRLVEKMNMNKGSALIIIGQVFPKLIEGKQFSRTLSVKLFEYFLKRISDDYGKSKLVVALNALKLHIDYIKEKGDSKIKLRKVYQRFSDSLEFQSDEIDEREQKEISDFYKKGKTREDIIKELKSKKEADSEKVTVNHKAYKRDNKTIALIKILRNHECQICGMSIMKRDGSKYVEAAHIIPKHKRGNEKPDNIILLCPNHHKEFDLGHCEIKTHTKDKIKFIMNGNKYEISLSIE